MIELKAGTRVEIKDLDLLKEMDLKCLYGRTGILVKLLNYSDKTMASLKDKLANYMWEDVWWVSINGYPDYHLPARCLIPLGYPKPKQPTRKEQNNMNAMFNVAIVLSPNVLAQQAGMKEEIITTRDVLAGDRDSAIAQVAAESGEAILAALQKNNIRVIVK